MTPQEAINILNNTPVTLSATCKTTTVEYHQMLQCAEDALEKQIPKKPTIDKDGCLVCGNCGSYEGIRTETNFIDGFCWECGQKIDRGDSE